MKSVGVHPCEGLPWGPSNRDTSPLSELVQLSPADTLHTETHTRSCWCICTRGDVRVLVRRAAAAKIRAVDRGGRHVGPSVPSGRGGGLTPGGSVDSGASPGLAAVPERTTLPERPRAAHRRLQRGH